MPSLSIMIILSDRKELLKWQIHPIIRNLSLCEFFYSLAIDVSALPYWKTLNTELFTPLKSSKKYGFIQNIPDNIYCKFGIFCYSSGNNAFYSDMPIYYTRFMRIQFKNKADLILELTGDSSTTGNMTEKQVILYTKQLLINGDDKIVVDLRNVNKSRPEQFSEFWKYIKQYLKEYAAVNDK
ncbi:hypothetical protein RhiirA1_458799 [Rhizophagus irregularis]|uniref:Uncharacterized protein n=1 Tax=Rhizophagus irregularis TaxID=588596 RepID=A0A2N0RV03_9GLOM|nr:hypothetical protein RhiirA1_458799 [Rhizophagus irregularis]